MAKKTPKWTPEQEKAIHHINGGAIVTAGAGSGKTAVLTKRVIERICNSKNPVDPSKIAVVTFTEKAAGELKSRLSQMMKAEIAERPAESAFLRSQNIKLKSAKISTISSFCFSLLRENIELTDLSAGFTVLDETKVQLMKYTICEAMLEEFYSCCTKAEKEILLTVFLDKNDRRLINFIITLYNKMTNLVAPEEWMSECETHRNTINAANVAAIKAARCYENLTNAVKELHNGINEADIGEKNSAATVKQAVIDNCEEFISYIENYADSIHLNDDKASGQIYVQSLPCKTACPTSNPIHPLREKLINSFKEYIDAAYRNSSFLPLEEAVFPAKELLFSLVKKFGERYESEKLAMNAVDFSDAERGVYNMLKNHPEAREKIGLSLIIVDEFQDSNRLQYEIFKELSDNLDNLYFVGDIKQSIYSFRGAQPEVFDRISHDSEHYASLPLNANFRSTDDVIDGINAIFDGIMTKQLGGVDYQKEGRLEYGRKTGRSDNISEVIFIDKDSAGGDEENAEALYIAQRIREMLDSGYKIGDRPCTENDFAVIMRAPKTKIQAYLNALARYGLRVNTGVGDSFADRPEIVTMLDYLSVIDNPYNDKELVRLLMSPIFGYSAELMAKIRTGTVGFDLEQLNRVCPDAIKEHAAYYRKKPLYSCLLSAVTGCEINEKYNKELYDISKEHPEYFDKYEKNICKEFTDTLHRLRNAAGSCPPSRLIQTIYDTTEAANLLMLSDDAEIRSENLSLLINYAKQYESGVDVGMLSDFIKSFGDMLKKGKAPEGAKKDNGNGVKVMSIHASKGLQFPVVFVSDCGKKINLLDLIEDVLFSEEYGICLKLTDHSRMLKTPTPTHDLTVKELKEKTRSEEMRLLYVAATRAEQKLIFTGTGTAKSFASYVSDNAKLPDCSKETTLAWLMEASRLLPRLPDSDESTPNAEAADNGKKSKAPKTAKNEFSTGDVLYRLVYVSKPCGTTEEENHSDNPVAAEKTADIENRIKRRYAYSSHTKIPAKYTATELNANHISDNNQCSLYVGMPEFMNDDEKGLSGKRRGDAYHRLMEYLPFDRPLSLSQIEHFIRCCTDKFLTDKERDCIKAEDIKAFFDTEIAARMIKCGTDKIYKEHPIFHRLDTARLSAEDLGITPDEDFSGAAPYIQGIADMFFIENDHIVLVDYKSDGFTDEEQYRNEYSFQLHLYKDALQVAFGMDVTEMYIYSFKLKKMIPIFE